MTIDICSAPGCGSFIRDDSKPCPECEGRGFNTVRGSKVPWTNSDWALYREKEAHEKL